MIIGFSLSKGDKEILELDVTIFPCILFKEIQYYVNNLYHEHLYYFYYYVVCTIQIMRIQ